MSRRVLGAKGNRNKAEVEIAPLIDMVFILLVFFVVTTTFIKESGVDISRPQSAFAQKIDGTFLAVAIDKTGKVYAAGREISVNDPGTITRLLKDFGTERIVIQSDREVPTGRLLKVLDSCKQSGAKQVDVAALAKK